MRQLALHGVVVNNLFHKVEGYFFNYRDRLKRLAEAQLQTLKVK